ncbi:hypothetical protein ACFSQ7_25830 [Paenibacillus rhizoplanae]
MFSMSTELTLAAILSFPLCMYGFKRFRSKTERLDKQYHGILDKGINYLNDFFTNLKAVHRCNGHQAEQKRWREWNDEGVEDIQTVQAISSCGVEPGRGYGHFHHYRHHLRL